MAKDYGSRTLKRSPLWPEVRARLAAGESAGAVATWLHEQGAFPNMKPGSLRVNLARVRRQLPASAFESPAVVQTAVMKAAVADVSLNLTEQIDTLAEERWAVRRQRARILLAAAVEDKVKMPLAQATSDLALYMNMVKAHRESLQSLGLAPSRPTASLEVSKYTEELEAMPRDERRTFLRMVLKVTGGTQPAASP